MGREADIISELIEVHADNFSINKRVRDASRLLASPFATVLTVSSGEITVTPKTGEGGGLFYFKIATLGIVHTINGLTEGDIIGIGYDDALGSSAYVGEDGSGGNCLFGPERLRDGEYLFVKCDKNGDLLLLPYEKEYDVQVLTSFTSGNAYSSDRRVYDLSGCTAESVLQIQAPGGDGTYPEKIEIEIIAGSDDYWLRVQPSSCTLDGAASGVVWDRLSITGERVVLTSNEDGSGWVVTEDGRDVSSGWLPVPENWTYASAIKITVPSGAESIYSVGTKFRLTANSVVLYGYIVGVADTELDVLGDPLTNHVFSSPAYSNAETPLDFPAFFTLQPTYSVSGGTFLAIRYLANRYEIRGKKIIYEMSFDGTTSAAETEIQATLPLDPIETQLQLPSVASESGAKSGYVRLDTSNSYAAFRIIGANYTAGTFRGNSAIVEYYFA